MTGDSEARIRRWRQYIDECRKEIEFLGPDGKREMQIVIASYERLIAMAQDEARKRKD
jgi:hypothetical protein